MNEPSKFLMTIPFIFHKVAEGGSAQDSLQVPFGFFIGFGPITKSSWYYSYKKHFKIRYSPYGVPLSKWDLYRVALIRVMQISWIWMSNNQETEYQIFV